MDSQTPAPESELHLIVLWETARGKEKGILEDMQKHVRILQAYDIQWTRERVADNFSRFYGVKLPDKSFKEIECGAGAFLLLVVRDEHPQYGYVETSRGHEQSNLTLFSLKEKYREWTNGGCKIHTTNSAAETNHDACLMLGKNYADLAASVPDSWDGSITHLERDITGADGWESMQQFFYTLNATIPYVVLRNEEILPEQFSSQLHGDIDLLTDDYPNLVMLTGAVPQFPEPYRVHYAVRIGGQAVKFDFRYVGDNYYCRDFEQHIMDTRVVNDKGIYVPAEKPAFFALIYHALIHKLKIAADYYTKIHDRFVKLGLAEKYDLAAYDSPFDLYYGLLAEYMKEMHYDFVRPDDLSVFYSDKLLQLPETARLLRKNFKLSDVHVCHAPAVARAYNLFLTAKDTDGTQLFIKSGPHKGIYRNEYRRGKALWEMDPKHFVRPVYYRDNTDYGFSAYEHLKGEDLETALEEGTLTEEKKAWLVSELHAIFKALEKSNVVHRDIRPGNFLMCGDTLKLVDFQMAIAKGVYFELEYMRLNALSLYALGGGYQPAHCVWDDAYSLLKVLNEIGRGESYGVAFDALQSELTAAIGKHRVQPSKRDRDKLCQQYYDALQGLLNAGKKKPNKLKRLWRGIFRKEKRWNNRRRVYLFGIRVMTYGKVKEPAV